MTAVGKLICIAAGVLLLTGSFAQADATYSPTVDDERIFSTVSERPFEPPKAVEKPKQEERQKQETKNEDPTPVLDTSEPDILQLEEPSYAFEEETSAEENVLVEEQVKEKTPVDPSVRYSGETLRYEGVIDQSGKTYTWYSEKVLPGEALNIPGRHVDEEGFVCDENGNICVASNGYSQGTVIDVPFGNGKAVVYDSCEGEGDELVDIYVSW